MTIHAADAPLVARVGARAAVGLGALDVAMCVRAGKLEPRASAFVDRRGATVGTARARFLPDDLVGVERLGALAAPALAEAAGELASPLPLVLALPAPGRPGDDARRDGDLVAMLGAGARGAIDVARTEIVRAGNAGFALAMAAAVERLRAGSPGVLVGAVDGWHHPEAIRWLDEERRLHAPGTDDGLLPSEGAAFALLTTAASLAATARSPALARLLHLSTTREGGPDDTPARALGEALRGAAGALAGRGGATWLLSDVNGEQHRVHEHALLDVRLADVLGDARHDQLLGELGDVGVAAGALLLAIASTWFEVGCAPSRAAIVALSSDGPERGAFTLEAMS
jgi:3-oxoacyl-[acyl-carrier-protein] synthase-1